jgi:hypothetical protein
MASGWRAVNSPPQCTQVSRYAVRLPSVMHTPVTLVGCPDINTTVIRNAISHNNKCRSPSEARTGAEPR